MEEELKRVKGRLVYEDEEIVVETRPSDDEVYPIVKRLVEKGITNPVLIRDILDNGVGAERIAWMVARAKAEIGYERKKWWKEAMRSIHRLLPA